MSLATSSSFKVREVLIFIVSEIILFFLIKFLWHARPQKQKYSMGDGRKWLAFLWPQETVFRMGRAAGQGHCRVANACGLVCVFSTFLKQEMIKKNDKKKSKYILPFFSKKEKKIWHVGVGTVQKGHAHCSLSFDKRLWYNMILFV